MTLLAGGSNIAVTTGVLNNGDGADGKFTISGHTDGKIYFSNRMGGTRSVHYTLLGG
jgi:hypothetical protein